MRQRLERMLDRVLDGMAFLAGVLIIFSMLSVSLGIVTRYVGRPLSWVMELNEYALLYVTFLVAAWVLRRDGHVKVDIVFAFLRPRTGAILMVINSIIGAVVSLILTVYGVLVTVDLFRRGVYNATLLSFPKGPLVAIIPVSCFLLTVQFFRRATVKWRELQQTATRSPGQDLR